MESKKQALNKRLDFLLKDVGEEDAADFKQEYKEQMDSIKKKALEIKESLNLLKVEKREVEENSFDYKDLAGRAVEIQNLIQENDPVALKNQYRKLFDAILVGKSDSKGIRPLHFFLKGSLDKKVSAH